MSDIGNLLASSLCYVGCYVDSGFNESRLGDRFAQRSLTGQWPTKFAESLERRASGQSGGCKSTNVRSNGLFLLSLRQFLNGLRRVFLKQCLLSLARSIRSSKTTNKPTNNRSCCGTYWTQRCAKQSSTLSTCNRSRNTRKRRNRAGSSRSGSSFKFPHDWVLKDIPLRIYVVDLGIEFVFDQPITLILGHIISVSVYQTCCQSTDHSVGIQKTCQTVYNQIAASPEQTCS